MYAHRRLTRLPGLLFLAALALPAACDSPSTPESGMPASLRLVSGDTQTAAAGETLADSIAVRVLNRDGQPVAGVEVAFEPASGVGALEPRRARTDADGVARAAWTLGAAAGAQSARARVVRAGLDPLLITATAVPGAPAGLIQVIGNHQAGEVHERLSGSLVVRVVDAHGNGVAGQPVGWGAYFGRVDAESAQTDGSGYSRAGWWLGDSVGTGNALAFAAFQDDSVWFDAAARPGRPVRVSIAGDSVQLHPSSARIQVIGWDAFGNAITEGAWDVTWTNVDTEVLSVSPDPGSGVATIATRREGTTRITARTQGLEASLPVRVLALEGPFTAVNTGLGPAAGLNDHGDVVHLAGRDTIVVWRAGTRVWFRVEGLNCCLWLGHDRTVVTGISNGGVVILRSSRISPHPHPDNSTLLYAGVSTQVGGVVHDMNDRGWAVGFTQMSRNFDYTAALWRGSEMTRPYGEPAWGRMSTAVAINNRDQVVVNAWSTCQPYPGDSCPSLSHMRAYVWENGAVTAIPQPRPGCTEWAGTDINDAGHVLVSCRTAGSATLAFVWNGTTFIDLAPITSGVGLNNRGEVLGWGAGVLYLWRNGQVVRLLSDSRGAAEAWLNNRGEILLNLRSRAYFLTPTP